MVNITLAEKDWQSFVKIMFYYAEDVSVALKLL